MDNSRMGIRPFDAHSPTPPTISSDPHHHKHSFRLGMWQKLHHFFGKDDHLQSPIQCPDTGLWSESAEQASHRESSSRPVGVGLPRQTTFRRQNSEKRDNLLPIQPCLAERRAVSASRRLSLSVSRRRSKSSPPPSNHVRTSLPVLPVSSKADDSNRAFEHFTSALPPVTPTEPDDEVPPESGRPPRPPSRTSSTDSHYERTPGADEKAQLIAELDTRWILNLSMHFRDKSDREKFFVTYAETPTKWRRVTISCDYRAAESGSLEMDLKELQFQRDKSMQIYESIRDSLNDIQFYDTVTNLKLETRDGRLHVHVTEDVNEIIPYPPRTAVSHILHDNSYQPQEIRESDLIFDSHISGFVYKVKHDENFYIKKDIPGPDSVDEFLYEINALHALSDSDHVIHLEAIIMDDSEQVVKGLLIGFAERGAVVDLLYDHRGAIPWEDRVKWAKHAVAGLSEIHEEGYVQGDFTLSNIVVDQKGNAKIIDINRRGCPVGWEPPEIARKIASNQRISMYIGEKTDLYQLGMTLWALAMDDDEPERHDPPLSVEEFPFEVPEWYQDIVRICLSPQPRDRLSAKELVNYFPPEELDNEESGYKRPNLSVRTEKKYIHPSQAVERDDIERFGYGQPIETALYSPESSRDDYTFTYPRSSNYDLDSADSTFERPRGRRPPTNVAHLDPLERHHWSSQDETTGTDDQDEPLILTIHPSREPEYHELNLDGRSYLVPRNTFSDEQLRILAQPDSETPQFASRVKYPEEARVSKTAAEPLSDQSGGRPPLLKRNSENSGSTPRNSHVLIPQHTQDQLLALTNGSHAADEIGLRNEKILETGKSIEHSQASTTESGVTADSSFRPPKLAYVDSGFDESESLVDSRSNDLAEDRAKGNENKYDQEVPLPPFSLEPTIKSLPEEQPPPLPASESEIKVKNVTDGSPLHTTQLDFEARNSQSLLQTAENESTQSSHKSKEHEDIDI